MKEDALIQLVLHAQDRDFRQLVVARFAVAADGSTTDLGPEAAGVLTTPNYMSAYSGIENRNWAGRLLRGMTGVVLTANSAVPPGTDEPPSGGFSFG